MNLRVVAGGMTAFLLAASVSLRAHHASTVDYDSNAPVTLIGRITAVEWVNPHSFIKIDCQTPNGTVENWRIEAGPPVTLTKNGITRELLAVGAVVKVTGLRAKNGTTRAWGVDMTFSDGKVRWMTDEPVRPGTSVSKSDEVPLTIRQTEFKPPTQFELLLSTLPFLPYLIGVAPIVLLVVGVLMLRRRKTGEPSEPR